MHDAVYKALYSLPEMIEALVRVVAPRLAGVGADAQPGRFEVTQGSHSEACGTVRHAATVGIHEFGGTPEAGGRQVDMKLKTAVWDQMVDTDRLARYYGRLAGKLARREKWAAIATTTFSVVSAYSVANSTAGDEGWLWAAIGFSTLTVAASVFPLVFRYGGVISSASYCQVRLGLLSSKCKELWLRRDSIDSDQALDMWHALERERSEITAFQSAKPLDQKLAKATEKESNAFWDAEAKRLNRIAKKRRPAIQAEAEPEPAPA